MKDKLEAEAEPGARVVSVGVSNDGFRVGALELRLVPRASEPWYHAVSSFKLSCLESWFLRR